MPAPADPGNFTGHTPALADAVDLRFKRLFDGLEALDAASIQDGILGTAALLAPDEDWQQVALAGGLGPSFTLDFYKDRLGVVRIKSKPYVIPTTTSGLPALATIATLPAGYRPGVTGHLRALFFTPGVTGSSFGWAEVLTTGAIRNGEVWNSFAAGAHFSLRGSFRAEN